MRNLEHAGSIKSWAVAKAISADDRMRMNRHAITKATTSVDHNVAIEVAILANTSVSVKPATALND